MESFLYMYVIHYLNFMYTLYLFIVIFFSKWIFRVTKALDLQILTSALIWVWTTAQSPPQSVAIHTAITLVNVRKDFRWKTAHVEVTFFSIIIPLDNIKCVINQDLWQNINGTGKKLILWLWIKLNLILY